MKKFALLALFVCTNLLAQENYTKGYYISPKGDTLKGYILYENWLKSPTDFRFRPSKNAEPIVVTATEAVLFSVEIENETYQLFLVPIRNISTRQIYTKRPDFETSDSVRTFLQTILIGSAASLYKYVDQREVERFFLLKNGKLTELINYTFYLSSNNKEYLIQVDDYKQQLKAICSDAPTFSSNTPIYGELSLRNFMIRYNKCFVGDVITYESKREKYTFDVGLISGYDLAFKSPIAALCLRANFPRNYQNQFAKIAVGYLPLVSFGDPSVPKRAYGQIELSIGSYFGNKVLRPMASVSYFVVGASRLANNEGGGLITANFGVSYRRVIDLEIGHVINPLFGFGSFIVPPRIAIHWHFPLSKINR
jgi:hypothetical protein